MAKRKLDSKPRYFRTDVVRSFASKSKPVDREAGHYAAGVIRGFSVVTRGEALGHGVWLDETFLEQTAEALSAKEMGVKSRFTHPSLSGDGLAKGLGRAMTASVNADRVLSDLHFYPSAHDTPDGDLAGYVMNRTDEDPTSFGTSIVYEFDAQAERDFIIENGGRFEIDDYGFEKVVDFESPDPLNTKNLPHARLATLLAVDVVDDPAANPTGMFHRGDEIAAEADALMAFSLGLTKERPAVKSFNLDPDRVLGFAQRFLTSHGLELVRKQTKGAVMGLAKGKHEKPEDETEEGTVAGAEGDETEEEEPEGEVDPTTPPESEGGSDTQPTDEEEETEEDESEQSSSKSKTKKQSAGPGQQFLDAFGEKGGVYFAQGKSFEEAQRLFSADLKAENEALKKSNAELQQKLSKGRGEEPVSFSSKKTGGEKKAGSDKVNVLGEGLSRFASGLTLPGKN